MKKEEDQPGKENCLLFSSSAFLLSSFPKVEIVGKRIVDFIEEEEEVDSGNCPKSGNNNENDDGKSDNNNDNNNDDAEKSGNELGPE